MTTTALQETPKTTQALANIFDQINQLELVEDRIIEMIPDMTDEQVLDTYNHSKVMGRSAWRIEIACHAEIWNRSYARRGRGNVDTEGIGIKAAVAKTAAAIGCSPRTIESNASVFKLVKEVEEENSANTCTILDEKGYWQAADASDDPKAAVNHFIEEKLVNPMFSVSDAFRWSKGQREARKPHVSELQVLADEETKKFLTEHQSILKGRLEHIPASAPFLHNMIHAQIGQAQWQLDRTPEEESARVIEAIDEGWQTGTEIYKWLQDRSYFMREPELRNRLAWMCDEKKIKEAKQGGRKDNQRGDLTSIYKLYSDRTGDAFSASRGNSIYDMGEPD